MTPARRAGDLFSVLIGSQTPTNAPKEETAMTSPTTRTGSPRRRRSPEHAPDYSLLVRFLAEHQRVVLTHTDATDWIARLGTFTDAELNSYRKALYWLSNVGGSESVRTKHGLPGIVFRYGRGKFVYDPDATVVRSSKRRVSVNSPVLRSLGYGPGDEVTSGTSTQRAVVIASRTDDDEAPPASPPVPARNGFALTEVLTDADGTLVLRHEDGSIIVATVTARTSVVL